MRYLTYVAILMSLLFLFSCTSEKKKMRKQITGLEQFMKENKKGFDKNKAVELLAAYDDYSLKYKEDTLVPVYLFAAGELSMNLNQSRKAIEYFDRIIKEYPKFKKTPDCYFLKGFIYDNNLQDYVAAREAYKAFVSRYPEHLLAKDANVLINRLGVPLEEIVKEFEEKNK
jgi:tetratricopeptide (TPR) repeat protein